MHRVLPGWRGEKKGLWAGLGHVYGSGGGRRGGAGCAEQDEGHCRAWERVRASPVPTPGLAVLTPRAGRPGGWPRAVRQTCPHRGIIGEASAGRSEWESRFLFIPLFIKRPLEQRADSAAQNGLGWLLFVLPVGGHQAALWDSQGREPGVKAVTKTKARTSPFPPLTPLNLFLNGFASCSWSSCISRTHLTSPRCLCASHGAYWKNTGLPSHLNGTNITC